MARVLIAPLGETPTVITAMVRALHKHPDGPGIVIDTVALVYPPAPKIIEGVDLITRVFGTTGPRLCLYTLDKAIVDVDSYEANLAFLKRLHEAVSDYPHDDVYALCSGGRKSMAALAAVVTQFHPQVAGLYHLLDRYERHDGRRSLYSIDQLVAFSRDERARRMQPSVESLNLINVPFQTLGTKEALARYLQDLHPAEGRGTEAPAPIDTEGKSAGFFGQILGTTRIARRPDVVFTDQASTRFHALDQAPAGRGQVSEADLYWHCFELMRDPRHLRGNSTLAFVEGERHYYVYQSYWSQGHQSRVLFSAEPYTLESGQSLHRLVVVALLQKENVPDDAGQRSALTREVAASAPRLPLGSLRTVESVLIVPVGDSPMVVTQALALLRQREGIAVRAVGLVYPQGSNAVRAGVEIVKRVYDDARSRYILEWRGA